MNYLLQPISEEIFKESVKIRFNNINEGFKRYKNYILQGNTSGCTEGNFIEFMCKAILLNGEENSYVDFYYSRLNEVEKNNLFALLNDEDKKVLLRHTGEIEAETIYFRLSIEAVSFITRLCTREVLFSSFYFTKFPCTIWGNYNMKFPAFFDNEASVKEYRNIAEHCGMVISDK